MGAITVRAKGAGRGALVAGLVASVALFASGCAGPGAVKVDPKGLHGMYRAGESGGEIRLHADGRFSAVGISKREAVGLGSATPVDFDGAWSAPPPTSSIWSPTTPATARTWKTFSSGPPARKRCSCTRTSTDR